MSEPEYRENDNDAIPQGILDLMLDVILDVMKAENGSVMLFDDTGEEMSIKSSRGLKNDIIQKTRVRLGSGISGKVAATGRSVFLKGVSGERRSGITPQDLRKPEIDTAYVIPLKIKNGTIGTLNVSSSNKGHRIEPQQEHVIQGIINRFLEYLTQIESSLSQKDSQSQLYMMNIFREYNTHRELRIVFDYIFHLTTDLLGVKKKGVFLLKNLESDFFDLVLGYGFEVRLRRQIYEELLPQINEPRIKTFNTLQVINRRDLFPSANQYFHEDFIILLPLTAENEVLGQLFLFSDQIPTLNEPTKKLMHTICGNAGHTIRESEVGQKFHEMTFTDSLTHTYNYGLWWKRLHEEFSRAQRQDNSNISLIVLDIDHFDRINESHGYLVGDELLRQVADRIKSCTRVPDIVGRIGGEEFGIILPGTQNNDAVRVADRIYSAIADLTKELRIQLAHPLSLSGGLATYPKDAQSAEWLVEKAKNALLSAKIMGGNRIKTFTKLEE
jgi:diguanylate cyclase (GGDEF)-like protein